MTDDEPLEGDIGPAAAESPLADARGEQSRREELARQAEELRRYEREREARRRRTNAVAGRITVVLVALLLAFLAYDSVTTALQARERGDPWIYPPAVIAALCLAGLAGLAGLAVRAVRRRR
ncbi:hypothetical protein Arub01_21110 [Actinomadura rubrobrunea]|uniref:Uncharacterized protein n=1 Tax=Actinomadura rubrobrunea TaxID=115335 RepID=A0A9W6PW36_9ACTN|nr:hypothetical protein [Actinomadura rubrobrunea]GLW63867.1 hypothetical protein Arub01_21110 [Actinomadura rubrobrunea]